MPTEHVLQLKVTLRYTKPSIWRRILIPEHYTFWDLHVAIQDAMGWQDAHLHDFTAIDPIAGREHHIGYDDESLGASLPGWRVPVTLFLTLQSRKMHYTYDFGDGWEHTVTLEQIRPRDRAVDTPVCLAGRRRCPPEDCGGPMGYERIIEILANPKDAQYEETMEWIGGSFDPDDFEPKSVTFDDPARRFDLAFSEG